MSLVDYASSSEDEAEVKEELTDRQDSLLPSAPGSHNPGLISSSFQKLDGASNLPAPPIEKLPDASLLLNSPIFSSHQISGSDHTSRVAAAMAESASRKRESNGPASSYPRSKIPRGNLRYSKSVPDTVGGLLVPPQLHGSNQILFFQNLYKIFLK
ncbi:PREDICTED: uncharacterized protein LOC104606274 isoform X2 [Nelumbo nucifera]|uniref:Uncharacterized protein LOC104606274 isoform X2 n=1 Tax=Nelumbo nucifera TaxID=4432 RepID=A0A1U8Q9T1_NELNU|nr:PREDICTED: uncharacterized protein LOC104606274 isoform X2 [Nelumbo nucifera]